VGESTAMKILTIRTDKPEAELCVYENHMKLAETKWQADRRLAETIHVEIKKILDLLSISYAEVQGIVVFKGPGSFTGLRIGMSVANALAYSLKVPIVAKPGDDWIKLGIKALLAAEDDRIALPNYAAPAKTTSPKK